MVIKDKEKEEQKGFLERALGFLTPPARPKSPSFSPPPERYPTPPSDDRASPPPPPGVRTYTK